MTKALPLRPILYLSVAGYLSLIAAFAVESKPATGPVEVVTHLYRDHAWEAMASPSGLGDTGFGPPIAEAPRPVLGQYFEHRLVDLLLRDSSCQAKHEGEICNLDFNILFSSQDPAATDLAVEAVGHNRVRVSFTYPSNGEKIRIDYLTVETSSGWRIKDIVYLNRNDSALVNILGRPTQSGAVAP